MIIDAHQHFWHYDPVKDAWITDDMFVIKDDFLPHHLGPVLDENGVDGCVAVQADQSENETAFLLELAAKHDFIKGVVGWIDLCANNLADRLAYYNQFPLLKGFRHIVQAEPDPDYLLREDFCRGIQQLAKYYFTYDILVYPSQLPVVAEFVGRFPNQRFIIDHLAKPDIKTGNIQQWEKDICAVAAHPNVYCKLSGMVTEADWQHWEPEHFWPCLDVVRKAFGVDRLVFGSDWPVCRLAGTYEQVMTLVTDYISGLSPSDKGKIMGGNAVKFYNL
jgi:L-fuconolactonase